MAKTSKFERDLISIALDHAADSTNYPISCLRRIYKESCPMCSKKSTIMVQKGVNGFVNKYMKIRTAKRP